MEKQTNLYNSKYLSPEQQIKSLKHQIYLIMKSIGRTETFQHWLDNHEYWKHTGCGLYEDKYTYDVRKRSELREEFKDYLLENDLLEEKETLAFQDWFDNKQDYYRPSELDGYLSIDGYHSYVEVYADFETYLEENNLENAQSSIPQVSFAHSEEHGDFMCFNGKVYKLNKENLEEWNIDGKTE